MRAILGLAFVVLGIELPSLRIRVATAAHRACDRLRAALRGGL